jgi:signal transduction histidine kinase
VRWLRTSWSLRKRLTVLSVLSAGLILAVGWGVLLGALHAYLIRSADKAALESAETIAQQVRDGSLQREILTTEEITTTAQVVQGGRVISATSNAVGDPPFVQRPQEPDDSATFEMTTLPYDSDGPFRVGALGAEGPRGAVTIYVAVDVEDAYDELAVATKASGIAALAILSALGGMLWFVLGAALAPVSHIIKRADGISGKGLHLRVPVPETGDEISALAATINSMLTRIESSVQRQDAFVADAAHELRTPLATLRTGIEVELRRPGHPEASLLGRLLTDVIRMADLVDQLLLLARNDARLVNADFEPVDIDDLVERAASEFTHPTIQLTVHQTTPVQIRGKLTLLEQVLPNLLANAARYAEARIDIGVETRDDSVVITVDDDGPGVPEADRERVFERFIRLDDSRGRATGGYGLGLAIVAQIVHMNAGRVEAGESPLGGARICIQFPMDHA